MPWTHKYTYDSDLFTLEELPNGMHIQIKGYRGQSLQLGNKEDVIALRDSCNRLLESWHGAPNENQS